MAKRLDKVEQSFWDTIRENDLIEKGDKIIVGVSGGPDSITLLNCLHKFQNELQCEIIVAHINHLIRKDSTDDEQFVENLCNKMEIKFFCKREDVEKLAKEQKRSTEEIGRIVRYEFFDEVAKKEGANKIAIAHNMNDNAETMLLNLIRGTGLAGLEGIQPMQYKKYIRPLINCERKDIEDYCEKNKLEPRIDSTNSENIYTRNKIRNTIIPKIEELNPNIVETLSRTSIIVTENNEFIEAETERLFKQIAKVESGLIKIDIKQFNNLSNILKRNTIIKTINTIQGNNKNINKSNIDDIIKLAENNIGNKKFNINKRVQAFIENGKLQFSVNLKL
ncbi:MAG: tRNA lysidine(34) synthetase TilS [Clostridia bacterium]|nr:tRNA lysidine(34) synthetase TilS [Clostridia bacterium]